ncbi:MAG: hypothetical protein ABIK09_06050 [Pseudomonadota bacterium]
MRGPILVTVVTALLVCVSAAALALTPKVKGSVRDEETLEAIEVVVRVPKPEAQIFTPKMKTKYQTVVYEKSFLKDILDSVEQGPF